MTLYIAIFIGLLILSSFRKFNFAFWPLIILAVALGGFRGESVGTDTEMYNIVYETIRHGGEFPERFEPLFNGLYLLCAKFDAPIWLVQVLCLSLCMFPIGVVIKKNDVSPIFALFLFYALFGYFYAFNLQRQMIAGAFVLLGFTYYPDKLKTLICFLIAMGFHSTAIIAFLIFLTPYISEKPRYIAMLIICSFIAGFIINESILIAVLGKYSFYFTDSHVSIVYGFRENIALVVAMSVGLIALFIVMYNTCTDAMKQSKWFKLYVLYIVINNLSLNLVLGTRMLIYFTMAQIIIYPLLLRNNIERKSIYIYGILILYATVYFFRLFLNNACECIPYETCL